MLCSKCGVNQVTSLGDECDSCIGRSENTLDKLYRKEIIYLKKKQSVSNSLDASIDAERFSYQISNKSKDK